MKKEIILSTTELFLIGKKVKLSEQTNIKEVIKLLKKEDIDTKHIENKEKLHSLFFRENETMFLLDSPKAENVFNDSTLIEILETDFLNLIDYFVEDKENIKKTLKSKFLKIQKDNNIILYRKKKIKSVEFVKDESTIIISFKNTIFKVENAVKEDYLSIENQLLN